MCLVGHVSDVWACLSFIFDTGVDVLCVCVCLAILYFVYRAKLPVMRDLCVVEALALFVDHIVEELYIICHRGKLETKTDELNKICWQTIVLVL